MTIKNKMDALDLLINILIEHEKKLDSIIERLENHEQNIEHIIKRESLYRFKEIER